ncbi:MAG: hypothetical protein FGF50_03235 [Candidatus Brockarchaeota archaeon]|nr:hypothetical protein [Candidatus Brockarchaeota archaeon]
MIIMSKEPSYYRRLLIVTVLIFTAALVGETLYLAGLIRQLDTLKEEINTLAKSVEPITLRVSLLVKYDGTERWFNNTLVPVGWTLFNLTLYALGGNVDYQAYPFGVFVTGIGGVNQHGNHYWFWYRWDPETRDWVLGETGADAYVLKHGDVLAWYLVDTSSWPPAKP